MSRPDIELLLDLIEEMMSFDKGPTEEEYADWCNKLLPLMHTCGRLTSVVEYF